MKPNPFTEALWKGFVQAHIAIYRLTKGRLGGKWTVLITTLGRRSGRPRTRALYAVQDHGRYVILAAYAGSPHHPAWYRNLQANPQVRVEDHGRAVVTRASTVTDEDEYQRFWSLMTAMYAGYDDYQQQTERKIPVVLLQPEKP